MDKQQYNKAIEKLSKSILIVILTFGFIPILLLTLTPLVYWQALLLTISAKVTYTIVKQITKLIKIKYENK